MLFVGCLLAQHDEILGRQLQSTSIINALLAKVYLGIAARHCANKFLAAASQLRYAFAVTLAFVGGEGIKEPAVLIHA